MNTALTFILAFGLGWWLAPALTDISRKAIQEFKEWREFR
jgi:hypothetical protein